MERFTPAYQRLYKNGDLEGRVETSFKHLSSCDVCALNCSVNRIADKLGACRTGVKAKVSHYFPHHGEEFPISGWQGSGTIFFTRCNLHCQYCQNHDISQTDAGEEVIPEDLAEMMLRLQSFGCHNINFVSPSHVVPQILSALLIAVKNGLNIPLVYNTGGYDSISMLKLLNGVIDIYMPDMKYGDSLLASKYSKIPNYCEINQAAVKEMYHQVGDLEVDINGLATHGLHIRHLVLPNNLSGTDKIVNFISYELSQNTYINIMNQYQPSYNAKQFPELNRKISQQEYIDAKKLAYTAGLHRFEN